MCIRDRGGAAHDGVIHQHDPLALDGAGHDVQLDADAVLALLLALCDDVHDRLVQALAQQQKQNQNVDDCIQKRCV